MRIVLFASGCALFAACVARAPSDPQAIRSEGTTTVDPAASSPAVDPAAERLLIDESNAARDASDFATARAKSAEAVASLLARPAAEKDAAWVTVLEAAGISAWQVQDPHTAKLAWEPVLDARLRTFPEEHPAVQQARSNLANALAELGELQDARDLQERVLEISSRTLSDEDPALQAARLNLSSTLFTLGEIRRAKALLEQVLDVDSRTLPDDHPRLQMVRQGLANVLANLGDLEGALALEEVALEVHLRTLPDDHVEVQHLRLNLAATLQALGDFQRARTLSEKALAVASRTLPEDHDDLQKARVSLASALFSLGDVQGARALQEDALEVYSRTLPDAHPHLQAARVNLAGTCAALGDLPGAIALQTKVLEVRELTLPEDHPDLHRTRGNLANTLASSGDLERALALEEEILEVYARALPNDHPEVQSVRQNHALTLRSLGDLEKARALEEEVCEVYARTLPEDHPDRQAANAALATTIGHQVARSSRSRGVVGESPGPVELSRERCIELIAGICETQVRAARAAVLESPTREAEERCARLGRFVDVALSFAEGYGAFEPLRQLDAPAFELAETTRGAALASADLALRAARSPRYATLRLALREASEALARLSLEGTTSEAFERALARRESAESALVELAREETDGDARGLGFDVDSLAARLPEGTAAVSFRSYQATRVETHDETDATGLPAVRETRVAKLCAYVIRSSVAPAQPDVAVPSTLTRVELGPVAPIEAAVHAWREGLGIASDGRGISAAPGRDPAVTGTASGSALRARIFDPLLPSLDGVEGIVVALDDALHLLPLDALPLDGETLLGHRWRIETRTTLTELLRSPEPRTGVNELVAVGDVEYEAEVASPGSDAAAPGFLRAGAWSRGFSALPATGFEVRSIAKTFRDRSGDDSRAHLCERGDATRDRLLSLVPRARWLHIATHGWFAPDSIRSWSDPEPLDVHTGLGPRIDGEEQVRCMSPMLLCGLALAGANLPVDTVGRARGLLTAEEISTMDLTNCELAVLSACDTNVGHRRAGQGVHSLQMALQMAGARSVITSLWKVPDEPTKELMIDFYRRLWVEEKPKWQALWEAKARIRDAKDEAGSPRYSTRDWAAWVLTGEPD